jgi:hypothetical protein
MYLQFIETIKYMALSYFTFGQTHLINNHVVGLQD